MGWLALSACTPIDPAAPEPRDGVVDLRAWSFQDDGPVRLDGPWSFAWSHLDGPGTTSSTEPLDVPGPWHGEGRSNQGYGTYHLTVLLPDDAPAMALRVGGLGGAGAVWANDVPIGAMGVVATDPDLVREDPRTVVGRFPPTSEVDLVVQVANERHRSSGIRKSVVLGSAEDLEARRSAEIAMDASLVAVMVTVTLGFLFVFALRRQEQTLLWFGLTCGFLALRHALTGGSELYVTFGPEVAWPLRLRVEYIATALGLACGYRTVLALVEADPRAWRNVVPVALSVVTAAFMAIVPFKAYGPAFAALTVAEGTVVLGALYHLVRSLFDGRRLYGILLMVSVAVFVFGVGHDTVVAITGRSALATDLSAPAFVTMLLVQGATVALAFAHALRHGEVLHESSLRYVPKDVLRLLRRQSIVEVERGDQTQLDMDVLFTDIRGYTTIAESMSPEALFPTLNRYLSFVVPPISEGGGFVSQYLGDGIMALFHGGADRAVRATVEMSRALEEFNASSGDVPTFRVGMGMSSGPVTLGVIGSDDRLDSNIVGDPANQASRVEGMTKRYGCRFLIDERTKARLAHPERFTLRELDRVIAKGKTVPTRIFEVLDALPEDERRVRASLLEPFAGALAAYRRGDRQAAREGFERCLDLDPSDVTSQLYLDRIETLPDPLPEGWDGTHTLTTK